MEPVGYILLYHLDPPYKHARHAWDFCEGDIKERLSRINKGEVFFPLLTAARASGSKPRLIRKLAGTKTQMFRLRKSGNAIRYCPECRMERSLQWQEDHLEEILQKSIERANRKKGD